MFLEQPTLDALVRGGILAVLALVWMVALIRINGLQTLSKMTNFDFVTTVAFGSLIAGAAQASEWTGFLQALAAILGLLLAQAFLPFMRKRAEVVTDTLENQPCLIMRNGEFDHEALKAKDVRQDDVIAKLREANVLQLSQVRAAVLEATGDVSVLHGTAELDEILLRDVRGA